MISNLPYDPEDDISMIHLRMLDNVSARLGVEFVLDKVRSVEETITAIQTLPMDISAIFRIPCRILNMRNNELSRAAIQRKLPMGASLVLDESVLMTFTSDFEAAGKQTARLAHQIHKGIKPADLPVEASEVYFSINVKTAEKIGLDIPEDILIQVKTIIQ